MGQPQKLTAAKQESLSSLGLFLQNLRDEDNVEVLIADTISYLQEQYEYSLIWIALYDRLNHVLIGKAGVIPGNNTNFLKQQFTLTPGNLLEQVVIEQRPLGIADLRIELRAEQWQEVAQKRNIQGTLILPICFKSRCLGVVLLGSERWGYLLAAEARAKLMMILGQLGIVLHQHEMDLLYKQTKRPDEPLLKLLDKLRTMNNLEQRLEAVVQATHEFVLPSRTNIYWLEREGRYFWLRLSNQSAKTAFQQQPTLQRIKVDELNDFYYSLAINQIVWVGEGKSSLASNFTAKLLQRFHTRSLLAAPIIWQKDLLGFLTVEGNRPRIWSDGDKNFVKGAAGLLSLVTPLETMESTIQKIEADTKLTSQVAQGIYSDYDLEEILRNCAARVLERFAATRFLLLRYNGEQNQYQVLYQSQPHNRRPLTFLLDGLKEVDLLLLKRTMEAIGVENLEEDLRFFNWRPPLLAQGVQSLLISNCHQGNAPEAILVITSETPRCWTTVDKELFLVISQQLGVIVRQLQLHAINEQQHSILRTFQNSLSLLAKTQKHKTDTGEPNLEYAALQQIASVLHCPLAILLCWNPGETEAEIIPAVIASDEYEITTDITLPVLTEATIQWALGTDSILNLNVDNLPSPTRQWLHGRGIGEILVMALRTTTDAEPTSVILLADHPGRQWSQQSIEAAETLISQLAWSRRWLQVNHIFQLATEELQQLNWYKHRRLEESQRMMSLLLGQIQVLGHPSDERSHLRYQQLLQQFEHTTASMNQFLQQEQWQLSMNQNTIPIASLLKRSLERVDHLLKHRKLWVGVHGLGQQQDQETGKTYSMALHSSLAIAGDVSKIELVFYELLLAACDRSEHGARIDIWCRRLDYQILEVSITDHGTIEPHLLAQLHQDNPKKVMVSSTPEQPLVLHLRICKHLMEKMGGGLYCSQLPDGRVLSRLLLPIAR